MKAFSPSVDGLRFDPDGMERRADDDLSPSDDIYESPSASCSAAPDSCSGASICLVVLPSAFTREDSEDAGDAATTAAALSTPEEEVAGRLSWGETPSIMGDDDEFPDRGM